MSTKIACLLLSIALCSCTTPEQDAAAWNASQHIPPPILVAKMQALESRFNMAATLFGNGDSKFKLTTVYYLIYSDGTTKEVDIAGYALARVPDNSPKLEGTP